jgi:drug/metabolite transporter (DMT)-like permease
MSGNVTGTEKRKVGLFDIRIIIASLIGLYGIILVITGLFSSDAQAEKAAGLNINIIAGIVMILFAAAFVAWARIRPIVVPPEQMRAGEGGADGEGGRPVH